MAAVGLLTVVLAAGVGQTAGASPLASTTTSTAAVTSTTTASATTTTTGPGTVAPTSSTIPGASTTTTTIPLPLFKGVSAPPKAATVVADPKMVAQAAHLELLITAQSAALDKLAVSYSQAQSAAQAALDVTAAAVAKLDASRAAEVRARADTVAAQTGLRSAAISAYLGIRPSPKITGGLFGPIYQAGLAHAYSSNVVGTIDDRVQAYRVAQRRSAALRKTVEEETRKAQAAQVTADATVVSVQAASQAATAVQAKLTATLATVQGELVTLVAAQRAGIAWQTYAKLGGGQALDFVPPKPLPALVPQTAAAIALVTAQMGKPYLWGGTGPDSFDCSGLMQWSWNQLGLQLPRVAADQQTWAVPVPISQVLPGDLVFFGSPAHHVGLYVGNGLMVDAPHTGAFVETVPIWWDELTGFGRVHA
jgi:peptidoglycan DL-endopeptidase CwlO